MLTEQLKSKMMSLKLRGMLKAFEEQIQNPALHDFSFEERLGSLIEHEDLDRENRRLQNRLKQAKLKTGTILENIDFKTERNLNKKQISSLSNCSWILRKQNLIITGPTGIGKSYLASSFAHKACREGFSAIYFRIPLLFEDLILAKIENRYKKLLEKIAKINVLVLDDWGLFSFNDDQRRGLLEVLEARYSVASTIIVSQVPVDQWFKLIGDPIIADAILDRVVHNSERISLTGESMRKKILEG
jgi:DNA replication protein DnaC